MATEVVQPHQLCTQKDRHFAFVDLQYIRDCLWIFEYSTWHGWGTTNITKHVQVTFHPENKKLRLFFCEYQAHFPPKFPLHNVSGGFTYDYVILKLFLIVI